MPKHKPLKGKHSDHRTIAKRARALRRWAKAKGVPFISVPLVEAQPEDMRGLPTFATPRTWTDAEQAFIDTHEREHARIMALAAQREAPVPLWHLLCDQWLATMPKASTRVPDWRDRWNRAVDVMVMARLKENV